MKPRIAVVGSLNVDLIASVERLPRAGETIAASQLVRRFGGKGANQALAAARQGAQVWMIGCVGDDADGREYREHFEGEDIDCTGLSIARRALTGTALIAVDAAAENLIVVAPGANGHLRAADVRKQREKIARAQALLVQLEVPLPAVLEAIRIANRAGVPVVFNPSPWRADFPWDDHRIDVAIVNESEAAALEKLRASKIATLVITRGAQPTRCLSAEGEFSVPTLRVKPIDTVGAGDAFAGALATALARGLSLRKAIARANCAGALATLKPGAQEALPTARAVEQAVSRQSGLQR
jgi:ribokinase